MRKFAGEGCNIAINYHENTAAAEALKEEVVGKYGIEVVLLKGVSSFCTLGVSVV